MYNSTLQYVQMNPLEDKVPPQLQKPILSQLQQTLHMLLSFKNSLPDEHETFYQWCTVQETIEVRDLN
jgi:hypothetical protein